MIRLMAVNDEPREGLGMIVVSRMGVQKGQVDSSSYWNGLVVVVVVGVVAHDTDVRG